MPIYVFSCGCGNTFEKFSSVKDWKPKRKCPKCGKMAHQNIIAEHKSGNVDSQMREYEFEGSTGTRMYGASYLPNQIDEARKLHKGTDFRLYNGCYLPVIKNRTHKLKYLKEMNFIEKD